MGKNLLAKAGLVHAPQTQGSGAAPGPTGKAVDRRPTTAIGAMAQFTDRQSHAIREAAELKERLKQFEDNLPVVRLDPRLITSSKWANREEGSFHSSEFKAFSDEIASAGGNIQPIKIRPVPGTTPQVYEIVYGHRRHRACLNLGLDVLAFVEHLDDKGLFVEMDRENRQRADLRPYEQGEMYRKALDEGLYPSLRTMADALGVSPGTASDAVKLAKLPAQVLDAFGSRLDIQYRWGRLLEDALGKDAKRVIVIAKEIADERKAGATISPAQVIARLTEKSPVAGAGAVQQILDGERSLGSVCSRKGKISIELDAKVFSEDSLRLVLDAIRSASR